MNISINIPTYGRAGNIQTFGYLPGASFWIHEFEVDKYEKHHPGIIIKVLPDEIRGNIARVRNYILKKRSKKDDVIVQFDDDMSKIIYFEKNKIVELKDEPAVRIMLLKYSMLANEFGVMLWGSNVTWPDKQSYREFTPFSMLSYISASFSCFMKGNDLFYDERFSLKEDYDMIVQQVNKYRRVLRINKLFYRKKGIEQIGGCASYRNVKKEMSQIRLLQKKWGKRIVGFDKQQQNHMTKKKKVFDINPIIKIPIRGV